MPSSVIRSFNYRPDEAELDIFFVTGRHYVYHDVPRQGAEAFMAAFSKGQHCNAHIRDRYDFTHCVGA